jgi:hypothetical protein
VRLTAAADEFEHWYIYISNNDIYGIYHLVYIYTIDIYPFGPFNGSHPVKSSPCIPPGNRHPTKGRCGDPSTPPPAAAPCPRQTRPCHGGRCLGRAFNPVKTGENWKMIQKFWDILGTKKYIYIYKSSVYLQSNKMSQLKYQIFLGPWIQQSDQNNALPKIIETPGV